MKTLKIIYIPLINNKILYGLALLCIAVSTVFCQSTPPSTNLLVWLSADQGVLADDIGVYEWDDQSGAANEHNAIYAVGNAEIGQVTFTNGVHPVVSFDGSADLLLDNYADLFYMTNYTIFIVGDVSNTVISSDWIGSWPGFVVGISDSVPGRIKFGTQNSVGVYQDLEPSTGADLANRVPYMMTAQFVNSGEKSLYVDGTLVGTQAAAGSIGWSGANVAIGGLGFSAAPQYLVGDIAEILVYSSVSDTQRAAVELYLEGKYFLNPGPVTITAQPQSQQVIEPAPVTFQVSINGTPPYTFQWMTNGFPIFGATNSIFTIPYTTTSDSAYYSVTVSNTFNSVSYGTNSQAVKLTVSPYTNALTVTSALLNYENNTTVALTFSALINQSSATNISNYSINNGVTVTGASAITQTNVILTTSPITTSPNVTLTVNGITDVFGNIVATNLKVIVPVFGAPSTPPSTNLLLWLAADKSVLTDTNGVYEWDDQSGAMNDAVALNGNAQIGQVAFPNAIHPVLSLDGTENLVVGSPGNSYLTPDFDLQNLTVYVVGDLDGSTVSDDFIGNWPGWVLGGSDGTPGALKWSTEGDNGADFYQVIDPSPVLGNRVPTLIEGAFSNPGNQTLSLNGFQVDILTNTSPIDYSTAEGLAIGSLFPTLTQPLVGDIAEILVYSNVSPAQDAAVQSYLTSKYFSPSATSPSLVSATRSSTQNTNVTIVFSEAVSMATATNASNYTINQGVTVNAVTMVNATTVDITTSPINPGPTYTLTVSGIADWAGNISVTSPQIAITGIPAPLINISAQAGTILISWDAATPFKLQSADVLTGPWSDVTGATSPYMDTSTQLKKFYRLSQ